MERLKNYIISVLKRHHHWREIGYDELSELYIGMMFRSFALSIIGVFIPLYLLELGYPVVSILTLFAWHYTFRIIIDYLTGRTVVTIGPKHTILVSYFFQILMLAMFLTLPQFKWPFPFLGLVWGIANSLFWLAYHVDFSKIKHVEHGGKEVGIANIVMRAGYAVGPVVGGVLATIFGAQYTFLIAALVLFIGLIPLLSTAEPVKTHRRLDFGGINFRDLKMNIVVFTSMCIDDMANAFYWPLFLSLFVLGGLAYAELGAISTVSMLVSITAARLIGQMTDKHRGRALYQAGILSVAATYLGRPLATGVRYALGLSVVYEVVSVGYNLPFYKGLYDEADRYGEHRIEFITILEMIGSVIRAVIAWTLVLLLAILDTYIAISLMFVLAAATCSIAVVSERFKALD